MSFDNVNEETKVCNICHVEKPVDKFRVNFRHCITCRYEINKAYSKLYYQQNKERLIKLNITNYKMKVIQAKQKPRGRPRIYNTDQQSEGISLLL